MNVLGVVVGVAILVAIVYAIDQKAAPSRSSQTSAVSPFFGAAELLKKSRIYEPLSGFDKLSRRAARKS